MSGQSPEVDPPVPELTPREVWRRLAQDPTAILVDVRSRQEWAWVGYPDLSSLGREPVFLEWQIYPDRIIDALFTRKLEQILSEKGANTHTQIFFLCRSGARSLAAAKAMALTGYRACHNVKDGFEGPLNEKRQRGQKGGWKAAGLPWVQS